MTDEVIVSPASDDAVVTYLNAVITGSEASIVKPASVASGALVVILTGGAGRRDMVLNDAQVTIEAWAEDAQTASNLMMLADGHLHAARFNSTTIRDVSTFGAPVNLPDPRTTGHYRYTATYLVTFRASAI